MSLGTGVFKNLRKKKANLNFFVEVKGKKIKEQESSLESRSPQIAESLNTPTTLKRDKLTHRTWLGRVLVVENPIPDCGSLGGFLQGEGLEVVCCTSAKEAHSYLRKLSFALVIVGWEISDIEHAQLLDLLKTSQPQLPVLFARSHHSIPFDDYLDPSDRIPSVESTSHHKGLLPHIYRILLARYDRYAQDLEVALEESTMAKRELHRTNDQLLSQMVEKEAEYGRINQALQEEAKVRHRAETSLMEREQQLLQCQASREAFCQDLHDGVLQLLYAVLLDLGRSSPLLKENPLMARQRLDHAIELLKTIMSDIRSFIGGRDQNVKKEMDFHCMVETVVNQLKVGEGPPLKCELSVDPQASQELTHDQASNLTFIVKEALSNCIRHGKATMFGTTLRVNGPSISLQVRDNGVGFSLDNMKALGHGLRNMTKRAEKIGGNINIFSKPSQGTSILVNLPRGI